MTMRLPGGVRSLTIVSCAPAPPGRIAGYNRCMATIAALANDRPSVTLWVRGVFRLPDGRGITRTVRWDGEIAADDDERKAVLAYELIETLEHGGHTFREGHAMLVELLGVATG